MFLPLLYDAGLVYASLIPEAVVYLKNAMIHGHSAPQHTLAEAACYRRSIHWQRQLATDSRRRRWSASAAAPVLDGRSTTIRVLER